MNQLNSRYPDTNDPNYSCWQLLPSPEPRTVSPQIKAYYGLCTPPGYLFMERTFYHRGVLSFSISILVIHFV